MQDKLIYYTDPQEKKKRFLPPWYLTICVDQWDKKSTFSNPSEKIKLVHIVPVILPYVFLDI